MGPGGRLCWIYFWFLKDVFLRKLKERCLDEFWLITAFAITFCCIIPIFYKTWQIFSLEMLRKPSMQRRQDVPFFRRKSSISITACYRALAKKKKKINKLGFFILFHQQEQKYERIKQKLILTLAEYGYVNSSPTKTKEKCEWNGKVHMNNHKGSSFLSSVYKLLEFNCLCVAPYRMATLISMSSEDEWDRASFPRLWALLCWPTQ